MAASRRVLEPYDRISEVLFGLIMALTFTGSLSVAEAGRDDVRTMLIGALGCNLAWGIIDGLLYLMGCLSEQGKEFRTLQALRNTAEPDQARRVLADALPAAITSALASEELDALGRKLARTDAPPSRPRLGKNEWLGALAVCLWVVVATFPVAIPFLVMHDVAQAMRASNLVAVALLFVTGYAFGRVAEYHAWFTGLAMVLVGGVLVALTMALGG